MVTTSSPAKVQQMTDEGVTQTSDQEDERHSYVLMLDGASLAVIFGNEVLIKMLHAIFECMDSIVVYRCSPHGKA